ncbi:MAG: hypothetical protein LBV67_09525 [Streptococcaceae bacterium]|jgi:hypothetical protein|nr:hypothetical protein [Streptococcaceae bacterium]
MAKTFTLDKSKYPWTAEELAKASMLTGKPVLEFLREYHAKLYEVERKGYNSAFQLTALIHSTRLEKIETNSGDTLYKGFVTFSVGGGEEEEVRIDGFAVEGNETARLYKLAQELKDKHAFITKGYTPDKSDKKSGYKTIFDIVDASFLDNK